MKATIYARVSTLDQTAENQLLDCENTSRLAVGRPSNTLTTASAA